MPAWGKLHLFGKVGLAERFLDYSGEGVDGPAAQLIQVNRVINNQTVLSFIFGAGVQYWFNPYWSMHIQYLHLGSATRVEELSEHAPNVNLILGGFGYRFTSW